jgi:hypothetical protein
MKMYAIEGGVKKVQGKWLTCGRQKGRLICLKGPFSLLENSNELFP